MWKYEESIHPPDILVPMIQVLFLKHQLSLFSLFFFLLKFCVWHTTVFLKTGNFVFVQNLHSRKMFWKYDILNFNFNAEFVLTFVSFRGDSDKKLKVNKNSYNKIFFKHLRTFICIWGEVHAVMFTMKLPFTIQIS